MHSNPKAPSNGWFRIDLASAIDFLQGDGRASLAPAVRFAELDLGRMGGVPLGISDATARDRAAISASTSAARSGVGERSSAGAPGPSSVGSGSVRRRRRTSAVQRWVTMRYIHVEKAASPRKPPSRATTKDHCSDRRSRSGAGGGPITSALALRTAVQAPPPEGARRRS